MCDIDLGVIRLAMTDASEMPGMPVIPAHTLRHSGETHMVPQQFRKPDAIMSCAGTNTISVVISFVLLRVSNSVTYLIY
jgi:hypothetical protein